MIALGLVPFACSLLLALTAGHTGPEARVAYHHSVRL